MKSYAFVIMLLPCLFLPRSRPARYTFTVKSLALCLLLKNLWEKDALKVNFSYAQLLASAFAANERKTARDAIN